MVLFLSLACGYLLGFWLMAVFYAHAINLDEYKEKGMKYSFGTQVIAGFLWPFVILKAIFILIKQMFNRGGEGE